MRHAITMRYAVHTHDDDNPESAITIEFDSEGLEDLVDHFVSFLKVQGYSEAGIYKYLDGLAKEDKGES